MAQQHCNIGESMYVCISQCSLNILTISSPLLTSLGLFRSIIIKCLQITMTSCSLLRNVVVSTLYSKPHSEHIMFKEDESH